MRNIIYKLLRSLEKVTKTDMVYIAKGGFWLGISQMVTAGLAILLAIVFARILPKDIYGNYKYILSLASLVSALHITGMGLAINRSVARGFEGIMHRGLSLYARWSVVGSALTLLAGLYYFLNDNTMLAISLVIVSIGLPILKTSLLSRPFLAGRKQFKLIAQYAIITTLIPTVLLITVASLVNNNVPILTLTYFVGYAATAYLLLRHTLNRFSPNNKLDEADVTYGKHLSVMNVFIIVVNHIDKVLIFQLLGAVPVAAYTFATAIPVQMRGFHKIIGALIFPKLSTNQQSRSFKNIFYKTILLTITMTILVGVYILSAPLLFSVLFPAYIDVTAYSQVFALTVIASAFGLLPVQALQAHRAQKKLYAYNTIGSLIEILLLVILISLYGIWGAVWARISGYIVNALLSMIQLYIHKTPSD